MKVLCLSCLLQIQSKLENQYKSNPTVSHSMSFRTQNIARAILPGSPKCKLWQIKAVAANKIN